MKRLKYYSQNPDQQNFDLADLSNYAYEFLGYATNNPSIVNAAQTAAAVKKTVLASTGKTVTLDENAANRNKVATTSAKVVATSVKDNIVKPIFSIFSDFKWIIIIVVVILVINFLRK